MPERPHNTRRRLHAVGIVLAFVLSSLALFRTMDQPGLARFDMKGTLKLFSQQLAAKGLSDIEQQAAIRRFTATMEQVTVGYSRSNNVILVVAPAVISGADDVTTAIQREILDQLSRQQQVPQKTAQEPSAP